MGLFKWLFGSEEDPQGEMTAEQAQREYSEKRSYSHVLSDRNIPIAISCLPSEYDNVKLDKMVGPHRVRTVGEYKDACQKFYIDL